MQYTFLLLKQKLQRMLSGIKIPAFAGNTSS